jgi:hypothetical protein
MFVVLIVFDVVHWEKGAFREKTEQKSNENEICLICSS